MKAIFTFLILCSSALAYEEVWIIGGAKGHFVVMPPRGVLLNKSCAEKPLNCLAGRSIQKAPKPKISGPGGKNPGGDGCMDLNGRVVLARNDEMASQAFCVFTDGSMASLDGF